MYPNIPSKYISNEMYKKITTWFSQYIHTFYGEDPDINNHIAMKKKHTLQVSEEMKAFQLGKHQDMQTLDDFRAIQMSWVFDLNFPHTFHIFSQRKYLEKIRDSFANQPIGQELYTVTKAVLKDQLT